MRFFKIPPKIPPKSADVNGPRWTTMDNINTKNPLRTSVNKLLHDFMRIFLSHAMIDAVDNHILVFFWKFLWQYLVQNCAP